MLYNNGDQFNQIYYQGKPVSQIWKNGECIYPGIVDLHGVLYYQLPSNPNVTSIQWSDTLPTDISYTQISRGSPYEPDTYVVLFNELLDSVQHYSSTSTYSVGDVVFHNASAYTCMIDISTPEIFNPNKWIRGAYPKCLGYYDSTATYEVGDIVYSTYNNYNRVYTCVVNITSPEEFVYSHWVADYCPELTPYASGTSYVMGDTVAYGSSRYTCIYAHVATESFIPSYWASAYYPELLGNFNYNTTYKMGDVVWYNKKIYTYRYYTPASNKYPTNTTYWTNRYYPFMPYSKGYWDSGKQYRIGDIVLTTVSSQIITWPNIPYDESEYKIYAWIDDTTLYLYCDSKKVRSDKHYLTYMSAESFSSVTNITALSTWDVSHSINMQNCFSGFSALSDLTPLSAWDVSNVFDFSECFKNCLGLTTLTAIASWDMSAACNMQSMFYGCTALTTLNGLQNWNTTNVYDLGGIFHNCTSLTDISALYSWHVDGLLTLEYTYNRVIYSAFSYCTSLTSLHGLENLNVSKVTEMGYLFHNCSSLSNITALSNWDVSNVINMRSMFEGCSAIASITALHNWDISSVTHLGYFGSTNDRHGMFRNCTSLTSLDPIANWDTSSVKSIASICENNTSLTRLYGLHWDLSECTSYNYAFYNCTSITEIKELYWTNIRTGFGPGCFENCESLVVADLSKCTATEPTGYAGEAHLFNNCPNLERCDLGTIITSAGFGIWGATNADFGNCTKLSLVIIRNTNKVFTRAYYYGYGDGLENLVRNNGKVYVPQVLLADYLASNDWVDLTQRGVEILALEGSPYEQPGSI